MANATCRNTIGALPANMFVLLLLSLELSSDEEDELELEVEMCSAAKTHPAIVPPRRHICAKKMINVVARSPK